MSDDKPPRPSGAIVSDDGTVVGPTIDLRRIASLRTVEVMETELDDLEHAAGSAQSASNFCLGTAGAFVGGLFGVLGLGDTLAPARLAVSWALLAALGLATAFFASQWYREGKRKRTVASRIRARLRIVETAGS